MKKALLGLSLGLMSSVGFAQMNGTYTINIAQATAGTNYNNFGDAASALISNGVNGAVTFNVIEGTYNGTVQFNSEISGTSTTNTITFQSASSNTNMPVLTSNTYVFYHTSSSNNLDNMTFRGLSFETTYNYTMYTSSGYLTNVTFEDCYMYTSNTGGYVWYSPYARLDNVVLEGCTVEGGYMSLYWAYLNTSSTPQIMNSDLINMTYYGVYGYASSTYPKWTIDGNYIANSPNSSSYGYPVYLRYPGAGSTVSNNEIAWDNTSGGYGIYMYYAQGNSSNPIEVYNNVIRYPDPNDSYTQYGLRIFYPSGDVKINHNTVYSTNDYSSYGCQLYFNQNGSHEFKNNIIYTTGSNSYSIYLYATNSSYVPDMSNNVYYRENSEDMYIYDAWNGGAYYDMSAWQSASSNDANSMVEDPNFISTGLAIPQSANVNNAGTPISSITTDINGATRSTSVPDPGAYEFTVPTNNAQPEELLTPDAPLCSDDTTVVVVVKNTGLVNLTSLTVNYSLNAGTPQTISWTGTLAPQALDTVTISSSATFSDGDNVMVWTSLPNGVADSSSLYDTVGVDLFDGLSGTYSIPNDYATLNDARDALAQKGVCGHVVFNISPGTYNEQVEFPEIVGTSEDATVTFQSSTGNMTDVLITYSPSGSGNDYVVRLDGADWFTFQDVSIHTASTGTYGRVLAIENGADNNTVQDSWLKGNAASTTSNYRCNVYIYGNNSNNTLSGNIIEAGSYSLYVYGGGNTSRGDGLVIEDNMIEDHSYYGAYIYYYNGVEFNRNTVTNDSGTSSTYLYSGVRFYYCDEFNVNSNYIGSDEGYGYLYPFYMGYCTGTNNPRSQISNNCIRGGLDGSTSYSYYPVYIFQSGIFDFNHNSVTRAGGYNGTYPAVYFNSGGLITATNNSIANLTGGYALQVTGAFTMTNSDYNNLYTTGNTQVYFGSSTYSTLEAYQDATGHDMHSVQTDPNWQDDLTCVTCNDTLNNAGAVLTTITDDISGNIRSTITPDIGAVEYVTPSTFTLGPNDTVCGNELLIEAGPAQSVTWNVNNQSYSQPSITLEANGEPVTYNVFVNIATEFCGSASDDVIIRLVPDAQLDANAHICADEELDLQPGGSAAATYTWSNGESSPVITVNEAGTYSVVKMEEGCESEAVIEVTQSAAVEIGDVEACSDDMPIELNATIADGTSYAWSAGSSVNTALNTFNDAGSYSVTASDSYGCSSTDNFNLIVLEEPQASIGETHSGLTYFFDASGSVYISSSTTYFWDFGYNGLTSTNQMATVSYPWSDPNNPATYNVSLTVNNGCGEDVKTMTIMPDVLGVEDLTAGAFALYPNPANDNVQFALAGAAADQGIIEVLDVAGRVLMTETISAGTTNGSINITDLASGSYMVKITVDGASSVNTLIKQ